MNIKTKNIIIIGLIIFIIYIIISNFKENFTTEEMNKYPQMLKTNCIKSRNIYNMLRNKNKLKCNFNTKKNILNDDINITDTNITDTNITDTNITDTNKDTINNKIRCSDDINKEITAKLDTESYCVLYDKLVNKSNNSNNLNNSDNSNNSNNLSTQIFKTNEGPDFINSFFIPAYDSNKISTYLTYTF